MKKTILTGTVILALAAANLKPPRGRPRMGHRRQSADRCRVAGLIVAATDGHAQYSVNYAYGTPAYCPPPAPQVVYCAPPVVSPAPAATYPSHRWVRYKEGMIAGEVSRNRETQTAGCNVRQVLLF